MHIFRDSAHDKGENGLKTCKAPNADTQTRIDLLDRAMRHGRNVETPEDRSDALSGVAVALYRNGQIDAARRLVEELKPLAWSFTDEDSRGRFAEALGYFDPIAAYRLIAFTNPKSYIYE